MTALRHDLRNGQARADAIAAVRSQRLLKPIHCGVLVPKRVESFAGGDQDFASFVWWVSRVRRLWRSIPLCQAHVSQRLLPILKAGIRAREQCVNVRIAGRELLRHF